MGAPGASEESGDPFHLSFFRAGRAAPLPPPTAFGTSRFLPSKSTCVLSARGPLPPLTCPGGAAGTAQIQMSGGHSDGDLCLFLKTLLFLMLGHTW